MKRSKYFLFGALLIGAVCLTAGCGRSNGGTAKKNNAPAADRNTAGTNPDNRNTAAPENKTGTTDGNRVTEDLGNAVEDVGRGVGDAVRDTGEAIGDMTGTTNDRTTDRTGTENDGNTTAGETSVPEKRAENRAAAETAPAERTNP